MRVQNSTSLRFKADSAIWHVGRNHRSYFEFLEQIPKFWNLLKTSLSAKKRTEDMLPSFPLDCTGVQTIKVASISWTISVCMLLCCFMKSITLKLLTVSWWRYDILTLGLRKLSLGQARRQVTGNRGEAQCLPPKPQALGHCTLYLEMVMAALTTQTLYYHSFPNTCPGPLR